MSEQFTFKEQLKEIQRFTDKLTAAEFFYYNSSNDDPDLLEAETNHIKGNACEELCFLINNNYITNNKLIEYVRLALDNIFKAISDINIQVEFPEFFKYINGKENE